MAAAAALVVLLAGCGSSSDGPSLTGKVDVPKGYVVYRAAGYSFVVPSGWRSSPYRTSPARSGVQFATPGRTPLGDAYPFVETLLAGPTAGESSSADFADLIADLRAEQTTILPSHQALADNVTVTSVKVPNASQARMVTVLGPGQRHERDLVALTSQGVLELRVAWYPSDEPLTPDVVIDSLRLH